MEKSAIIYANKNAAYQKAKDLCVKHNELTGDNAPIDDIKAVEIDLNKAVSDYAVLARRECFDAIKASDDPMVEACKRMQYEVIAVKDSKVRDGDSTIKTIATRNVPIDLEDLHQYCGGIGHDSDWLIMLEAFNYRLGIKAAGDIKAVNMDELRNTYAIRDIARDYDLGRNPTSSNQLLNTLRRVISAMIGDEYANKVLSHDVRFLLATYGGIDKKKVATYKLAGDRAFRNAIQNICHKIIQDIGYSVSFKAKKN